LRRVIALLSLLAVLLCGCTVRNPAEESFWAYRERLCAEETVTLKAKVTSCAEETVFVCTLGMEWTPSEDTALVTVYEPAQAAGITAQITGGGWSLGYDTQLLAIGQQDAFSPMSCLYDMAVAWADTPVTAACYEGDSVHVSLCEENDTDYELWLAKDTMTPVRGEILQNGIMVLTAEFME